MLDNNPGVNMGGFFTLSRTSLVQVKNYPKLVSLIQLNCKYTYYGYNVLIFFITILQTLSYFSFGEPLHKNFKNFELIFLIFCNQSIFSFSDLLFHCNVSYNFVAVQNFRIIKDSDDADGVTCM